VRLYPELAGPRLQTLLRDVLTVVALVMLALVGLAVYHAVDALSVLGRGVHDSGAAVQDGFDAAADKADDVPLVGGEIGDGLRSAGEGTGGNVADLGQEGENRVHRLALILGLTMFGLPAVFLLGWQLPPRLRQVRGLTAAERVLRSPGPEVERFVAMRAAFSLPYGELLAYTPDPLGDLAAGRHAALVEAAFAQVGLRTH
jgi:hypothetical protein